MKRKKIYELGPKEGILCKTREEFEQIVKLPGAEGCKKLQWEWNRENHVIFPYDRSHCDLNTLNRTYVIYPASDFLEENKTKEFSHYNI